MSVYPTYSHYAVVRIDPIATVQSLEDDEALEAAQKLETKHYAVYLHMVCHDAATYATLWCSLS